jgi:hypothetical protein
LRDIIARRDEDLEACERRLQACSGVTTADGVISYRTVGQLSAERDAARQETLEWERRYAQLEAEHVATLEHVQGLRLRINAASDPVVCRAMLLHCEDEVVQLWNSRKAAVAPDSWWKKWLVGHDSSEVDTCQPAGFVEAVGKLKQARMATQHVKCEAAGIVVRRVPIPFEGIASIAVSCDGSLVAVCGETHCGGVVALFRLPHGEKLASFVPESPQRFEPVRICFADDDNRLLVSDSTNNCVLHLAVEECALCGVDVTPAKAPFAVAASNVNKLVAIGSRSVPHVRVLRLAYPQTTVAETGAELCDCVGAAFHEAGHLLACIDTHCTVQLYSVSSLTVDVKVVARFAAFSSPNGLNMCDVAFTNGDDIVCAHLGSSRLSVFERVPLLEGAGEAKTGSDPEAGVVVYHPKAAGTMTNVAHRPIAVASCGMFVFVGEYVDKSIVVVR